MNWKVNYWTFLFAAALIAALYLQFSKKAEHATADNSTKPDPNAISCDTVTRQIAADSATADIARFQNSRVRFVQNGTGYSITDTTAYGFEIPACELRKIVQYKHSGDEYTYAFFALKPAANNQMEIKLYFKTTNPQGQEGYFDFSRPCPICPPRG